MNPVNEIRNRLSSLGCVRIERGQHEIWRHPNSSITVTLSRGTKMSARALINNRLKVRRLEEHIDA